MFGFELRSLRVVGPDVADAEVRFTKGLNVIAGPSDTGKTFIVQCINFAMGSSKEPKRIKEAARYASIFLELESNHDSRIYVLERSLRGAEVRLTTEGQAARILKGKHQADAMDTVSAFLLELSGLSGKRIRTKKLGTTRHLSFRDVARLVLVDELAVQSEESPIYSGQRMSRTAEEGVFRMLLTGIDDSSVIAGENPALLKVRHGGRTDVIETMLLRLQDQMRAAEVAGDIEEKRRQLSRAETAVEAASSELLEQQQSASALEERRRNVWSRLRQVESKEDVLSELQKRFDLLREQYESDLRRLAAITEVGVRLAEMKEERCPVCGALAEHHEAHHRGETALPSDVAQACRAEAIKTRQLLSDLQNTLESNAGEVTLLAAERRAREAELEHAGNELQTLLQPRVQAGVQRLRAGHLLRERVLKELELLQREAELKQLLATPVVTAKVSNAADTPVATVDSGSTEQFSKEAEAMLRSWRFPNLDRVTFSDKDQDLVISGRPRGSHGKGVRAITHSAFNLALLRLCTREQRPFPAFNIIDSPLVVYRQPDLGEAEFPHEVKDAFYRAVSSDFNDVQVIIVENDEPPSDVNAMANVVLFTGTGSGRRGFIP